MEEIYELLISEREKIERELEFERSKFDIEMRKNFDQELCFRRGFIDITEVSLEKKNTIVRCANDIKVMEAKKYVFERIIKKYGYKYNWHGELLESEEIRNTHSNVKITCDRLYQDENGRFTEGKLHIGRFIYDCPYEMSFEEYMSIYYSSLEHLIGYLLEKNNERISVVEALEIVCARILREDKQGRRL